MKRSAFVVLVGVFATLLSGCTSIPPGFTQAEWNALTPKEQARYVAAARNADLPGFKAHLSSARSDADSTIRSLNPTQSSFSSDPSSTR